MSDIIQAEARTLIRAALDRMRGEGVADTWLGPRSSEVGMMTETGQAVTIIVLVKDVL